jgi:hypothetical protein
MNARKTFSTITSFAILIAVSAFVTVMVLSLVDIALAIPDTTALPVSIR